MARIGPGQRITRAEVLQQSHDVLERAGLNAHSRADFIRYLCLEILGLHRRSFVRFDPTIHERTSIAWDQAFTFVFQYILFHKLTGTIETTEAELKEELPDIPITSTDEQFLGFLSASDAIPSLPARVDALFPKKHKRTGQTSSPRVLRRGAKTQTPAQKRKGGKSRSGKSSGLADNSSQIPFTIGSPGRDAYPPSMDSEELGSDIVVTEIYEKPNKKSRIALFP
jgi:hypothetical protein